MDKSPAKKMEMAVINANTDFYRQIAHRYDRYESCTFAPYLQQILEHDLHKIAAHFHRLGRVPRCLDCGGGTGNLALKMLARDWPVTVVDVSDEMLSRLQEKAKGYGYAPKLIHSSIERFLDATQEAYDFLAFSSVLHHLYSYVSVVERSIKHLRPQGIFYSNYDPVPPRNPSWAYAFDAFDTAIAKLLFDPADVLPGTRRRLRKLFSSPNIKFGRRVVSAGDLAEFHVRTGVDDAQVVQLLQANGFSVVEHTRFASGRTSFTRSLNQPLRLLESFKIIARRQ